MPTYNAPVEHALFLLKDVLKLQNLSHIPGYDNIDSETLEQIIVEAAKLADEIIAPTNQAGDHDGCIKDEQGVHVPNSFREPWEKFKEGGWLGLSVPEEYGGQGLPYSLATVINEFISSANMAFSLYPGLTRGAIQALLTVATEEQKQFFIPKMVNGEWTGTMNLTEPHCGTDLGLIKTKAVPTDVSDPELGQHYLITGQKIFISCGEHDLASSIVHLVLARIEGDPEGTKGISLFLVPKHHTVTCGSIEHKMGIHGSSTCVMNYDGAIGYLVGERCKGLNAMFIMMNEARLGVAVQGLSQSEIAYQNAVAYAKDRIQGAKLTDPKGKSVAIIDHPDVRRMLLDIKSFNEAARLLIYMAAIDSDIANRANNPAEREAAEDRLGLLTPILKGVLTDIGFDNTVKAQQVFGGHGYIKEWGMEQFVRDARIAQIYEGANGIQALDLVGRKLPKNNGKAILTFMTATEQLMTFMSQKDTALEFYADAVKSALNDLKQATMWLMQNAMKNPNNAGSASYDYMHLFGKVLLGVAWVSIVNAALEKKAADPSSASVMDAKFITARYFMEKVLPDTSLRLKSITAGSDNLMSLPTDLF